MFDSRNSEYSWANAQIVLLGVVITRIHGVKFSVKKEKEYLFGRGDQPHAIQHGNKTYEGELTLLQSHTERLQSHLALDEDLTDLQPFDITVSFVKRGERQISTYILKGAEFTEDPREIKQGDKMMEITLPILFLRREVA